MLHAMGAEISFGFAVRGKSLICKIFVINKFWAYKQKDKKSEENIEETEETENV